MSVRQDLKQAFRGMRKAPTLTAIAVLSLALGIGGTTAIFTVVQQVLLKSFPYKDPDRIVSLRESNPSKEIDAMPVTPANAEDWIKRTQVFEEVGLSTSPPPFILT